MTLSEKIEQLAAEYGRYPSRVLSREEQALIGRALSQAARTPPQPGVDEKSAQHKFSPFIYPH